MLSLAPLVSRYLRRVSRARRGQGGHVLAQLAVAELEREVRGGVAVVVGRVHVGAGSQTRLRSPLLQTERTRAENGLEVRGCGA
jgi:hypothetical protein